MSEPENSWYTECTECRQLASGPPEQMPMLLSGMSSQMYAICPECDGKAAIEFVPPEANGNVFILMENDLWPWPRKPYIEVQW